MNKALLSSKNMCWCTPQDFFDKLNAEFGFVLDPAATDKTAKCSLYYTPETDGLSQSWDRGGAAGNPVALENVVDLERQTRENNKAMNRVLDFIAPEK